ncbi:MAG: hypothetical protein HYR96_03300 [Deltaproteobacteria bacterium]|nr:hypothetical protein [Deltaproteobacteria bacterium]MBI3294290.1 hypothetical protein [Deltaproteobacteria bacterium]
MTQRKFYWIAGLAVALLWCVAQVLIVHFNVKFPGPDVYQFKAPALELATRGTLTGINLPNAPIGVRTVYAFYPPVFPVVLGGWFKVFGVSYGSSLVFDSLWRLTRSVIILLWVVWLLGPYSLASRPFRALWIIAFLFLVSFFPNNEDRPDEMALCLILSSLLVTATRPWRRWWIVSGLLLGFAAGTSPTAGLFGALAQTLWLARGEWRSLVKIGAISFVVVVGVCIPVVVSDPLVIERFLKGAHYNVLPHSNRSSFARDGYVGMQSFLHHLSMAFKMGRPMYLCLFSSLFAAGAGLVPSISRQTELLIAAVVFTVFSLIVFPIEPLYLWFSCALLWIVVLPKWWLTNSRWQLMASVVFLFCGVSLMAVRELKLMSDGLTRAPEQTLQGVQEYLKGRMKEGQRLAITSDGFFTAPLGFSDNLDFVCAMVFKNYDFAFVTEPITLQRVGSRGVPAQISSLCFWTPRCFELVEDRRPIQQARILGVTTPFYVRGYGGLLYRNVCRITGVIPPY